MLHFSKKCEGKNKTANKIYAHHLVQKKKIVK